ncbi:MAG: T9SS type A sorting domain-containing protein [Bacteroidales bacterium]|nr:T9SS type A sorting domain-containing protein [Bacteroidales bacterium]
MNKRILITTIAFFILNSGFSQISITTDDMPQANDTIRTSTTILLNGYDYTQTGEGFTWDISDMVAISQKVDTFINSVNTPILYQVIFIPYIVANLAMPVTEIDFIPGFEITEIYNYYKNNSDKFVDVGFACTFNSIPLPVKYSEPDLLYDFPVNYGNMYSSNSSFELNIDDLGFLGRSKDRINTIDGWGTLITPYGSFETLRIKSEVFQYDSIYIDSLGVGFPISRQFTEYKWLGENFGLPLLQITEEGYTATAIYIDSVRAIPSDIAEGKFPAYNYKVYPNPASGSFSVSFIVDDVCDVELLVYSILGTKVKTLFQGREQNGLKKHTFSVDKNAMPKGIYFLMLRAGKDYAVRKLVIQ